MSGTPNQAGLIMKYFVLKPKGKTSYHVASRHAMRAYAGVIQKENPELAFQLRAWADTETRQANMED